MNTDVSWPSLEEAEARVLRIQTKLHQWATQDPGCQFDDLFNLVVDPAFLVVSWERVRANRGGRTAGVDGVAPRSVTNPARVLSELRAELKARTFSPSPVREVLIPKAGGKTRMLGIATACDRVVQASMKLVLEPIFEADFKPCSYGFRPRRRAQDAIAEIHLLASHTYEWVLEGDIKACFDEIAHSPLLGRVRDRIGDKRVLALVKAFLHAGILSEDGVERDTITGTPQGGILSPLLANIALSVLDEHFAKAWEAFASSSTRSRNRRKGKATYKIVRYADDFVIMVAGTQAHAEGLRAEVAAVLAPMGLRLSEAKTKVCHIDEGFDFLGFHIQRRRKRGTNKQVVYTYPSKKALLRVLDKVRVLTRNGSHKTLTALLHRLNRVLRGWCNYFKHGVSAATFAYLGQYAWERTMQWLRKRHHGSSWSAIGRRYLKEGRPIEGEVTLLNPATVTVIRYRYRGTAIPSPWPWVATGSTA